VWGPPGKCWQFFQGLLPHCQGQILEEKKEKKQRDGLGNVEKSQWKKGLQKYHHVYVSTVSIAKASSPPSAGLHGHPFPS